MVDEMLTSEQNELPTNTDTANLSAIEIGENFLTDAKAAGGDKRVISVPIAQLATLGTAVSSIIPPISKLTQAATTNGNEVLYRLVNAGADGTLKKASNGDLWGALRVSGGKSKMARFQAVAGTASTQIPPIDPVTVMMAVALFTIEQKLDKIEEIGKQIMSFLEIEKESEIEADLETLFSVLAKYKHGWDNEHYIAGNYKLVLDIQRTARKHMNSYQKKVTDVLNTKKLFVSQSKINGILNDLLKKFKY